MRAGELVGDLLHEQYDLIYGSWPQNYDEVMLIVNKDNEIFRPCHLFAGPERTGRGRGVDAAHARRLGFDSKDIQSWSYEDLCNMMLKIVLPAERYQYDSASGTYTDVSIDGYGPRLPL